jgi:hypothetical protein
MNESGRKQELIVAALAALEAAREIDEREDRPAVAWYNANLLRVKRIEVIAGAMRVEIEKRRGEIAQGKQGGGDQKAPITIGNETYLTAAQCAALIHKSARSLREYERRKVGPRITRIGCTPLYRLSDVQDWLANGGRRPVGRPRSKRRA